MEYTATSFAEPLQRVFDDVVAPETDVDVDHHEESRYLVRAVEYRYRVPDRIERRLYQPVLGAVAGWGEVGRRLATWSVHRYLGYGFYTVCAVLGLLAVIRFVHRGIEKLFQGRRPEQGIELAERISGDTTIGHTLAFCQAIEDALGLTVLPRAQRLRAILLELERLYNHITDIGALGNDVGHSILHTHAQRVREQLLRLNDERSPAVARPHLSRRSDRGGVT
jgi:hypothetical protein